MSLGREPLTPLRFLRRSADAFADRVAVVDDEHRWSYAELEDRVAALAGVLAGHGIGPGDRVALLAPNTPMMLEAHFAVPALGAVMVPLNIRLAPSELRGIVEHSGARLLLFDDDLADGAAEVGIDTLSSSACAAEMAVADRLRPDLPDEESLISLCYTSGTTGRPKGAMYVHRGAYLQALAMAFHSGMRPGSVHLWTLPMFHCNGWSFPWAVTATGATHVCLRKAAAPDIWARIAEHGVTHLNAAPTVLVSMAEDPAAHPVPEPGLRIATGGAAPAPALLDRMRSLNVDITHLYGLTETYGPSVVCDWQPEWDDAGAEEISRRKARQGVVNVLGGELRVVGADGLPVPADGVTVGEVQLHGDNVMRGYYRDPEATREATDGDWFRTGDVGVVEPDGYVALRDRIKDIIISGGENIASIEVEHVLMTHPAVIEAAVVGRPDAKWGEVPVAFVSLRDDAVTDEQLIGHARARLAGYKVPRQFVRGPLPRTATGKVQKFRLRDSAAAVSPPSDLSR